MNLVHSTVEAQFSFLYENRILLQDEKKKSIFRCIIHHDFFFVNSDWRLASRVSSYGATSVTQSHYWFEFGWLSLSRFFWHVKGFMGMILKSFRLEILEFSFEGVSLQIHI